ncbi:Translocation protein S62 [Linnemannia exigua]|uniref:Translocation protein SEC62 n=1 Tax=Linnemannia exigua TaxID=604196 RepID=A0AAD4D3Y0_9FUNG|nr:Translocation protein S62 [Linnemannia exigua]
MEANAPPERPKNLCQVADYVLRKGAVNSLLKPEFRATSVGKELGELTREQATELLGSMIPHQFFLKCERPSDPDMPRNMLQLVQYQSFSEDAVFIWRYEGSQLKARLMAVGLLLIVLAGVMFPLWPVPLRLGVWYLSVGILILLGLFFAMAIVRLILFGITYVILKPGIWIFPNLFEDVGFVDSFIPLWGWHEPEEPKEKQHSNKKAIAGEEAQDEIHTQVVSDETAEKISKRRPMVEDAVEEES